MKTQGSYEAVSERKAIPALTGQAIYPRPLQDPLPIWVGVGGTAASFVRAGTLGLPPMAAIHWRRTQAVSAFDRPLP